MTLAFLILQLIGLDASWWWLALTVTWDGVAFLVWAFMRGATLLSTGTEE